MKEETVSIVLSSLNQIRKVGAQHRSLKQWLGPELYYKQFCKFGLRNLHCIKKKYFDCAVNKAIYPLLNTAISWLQTTQDTDTLKSMHVHQGVEVSISAQDIINSIRRITLQSKFKPLCKGEMVEISQWTWNLCRSRNCKLVLDSFPVPKCVCFVLF